MDLRTSGGPWDPLCHFGQPCSLSFVLTRLKGFFPLPTRTRETRCYRKKFTKYSVNFSFDGWVLRDFCRPTKYVKGSIRRKDISLRQPFDRDVLTLWTLVVLISNYLSVSWSGVPNWDAIRGLLNLFTKIYKKFSYLSSLEGTWKTVENMSNV